MMVSQEEFKTAKEIEAARQRLIDNDYRMDLYGNWGTIDQDQAILAAAFVAQQQSQPVNERLLATAKAIEEKCFRHGHWLNERPMGEDGRQIFESFQQAIAAAEAEIAEREKEVDLGLVQESSDGLHRIEVRILGVSKIGAIATSILDGKTMTFAGVKTRGDVLDLLRVLEGVDSTVA